MREREIVPKAVLKVRQETIDAVWDCPACQAENVVFLFSEEIKAARREAGGIENVECDSCGRRFNTL